MSSQNFPQIRISDDRNSLYGQFSSTKEHFLFRCKGRAIDGSICSKKYKIKVADFLCEINCSKRSQNGYKKGCRAEPFTIVNAVHNFVNAVHNLAKIVNGSARISRKIKIF